MGEWGKQRPRLATGSLRSSLLGRDCDPDAMRPWPLGAGLDLEAHLLATDQAVEVAFGAAAVEEVLATVVGGDEAKPTLRHELLDGSVDHDAGPPFPERLTRPRVCSREGPGEGAPTLDARRSIRGRGWRQTAVRP